SVFAHDSDIGARNPAAPAAPTGGSGPMDPKSPYNDMGSGEGPAPQGMKWPTCSTAAPQAPHRPFNSNLNPNHFFRIEFLRVEGEDFQRALEGVVSLDDGAGEARQGHRSRTGAGTEFLRAVAVPDCLRFDPGRAEQLPAPVRERENA